MELRHLRYFVMVAREQSFTRAAEKLHIAQPPLSRQIQQLEEELGVALIQRSSRPAFLTEAGRLLYEQAIQVLDRVEEIRGMMRRLREAQRGRFGIGFVGSTLYSKLPEVIRRFRAVRPDMRRSASRSSAAHEGCAIAADGPGRRARGPLSKSAAPELCRSGA